MKIKITQENMPHNAMLFDDIEIELPDLYLQNDGEDETKKEKSRTYLTEKDIIDRLRHGNEYHVYLLASVVYHKCKSELDEQFIKGYVDAFEKSVESGNMDTVIRGFEMVLNLVLGNEVRYW